MRETSGPFHVELSANDILDTTTAMPQTGKDVTGDTDGFEAPAEAVLDTTSASPQVSKTTLER